MTINIFKCTLLGPYQELIGVEISDEVNTSEESKQNAFHIIEPHITFSYLAMLLAVFKFYALWIPFFEVRVLPWQILSNEGTGKVQGIQFNTRSSVGCGIIRTS